jgi:hypothetical protein
MCLIKNLFRETIPFPFSRPPFLSISFIRDHHSFGIHVYLHFKMYTQDFSGSGNRVSLLYLMHGLLPPPPLPLPLPLSSTHPSFSHLPSLLPFTLNWLLSNLTTSRVPRSSVIIAPVMPYEITLNATFSQSSTKLTLALF